MNEERPTRRQACELVTINDDDDVEDPVEQMIEKTGCAKLHYALQDCMAEHQDWRKCQNLVKEFRVCMEKYQGQRTVYNENANVKNC